MITALKYKFWLYILNFWSRLGNFRLWTGWTHSTMSLWCDWYDTICWFAVVGYPLTVIGATFGRSIGGTFDAPSRPKPVAREIPSVPWFRTPVIHCIIGGFLPFRLSLYRIFMFHYVCICLFWPAQKSLAFWTLNHGLTIDCVDEWDSKVIWNSITVFADNAMMMTMMCCLEDLVSLGPDADAAVAARISIDEDSVK